MNRKTYGIFVAGGTGTRMGSDIPKQFLELDGVPILQRTISRFVEAVPELRVVTVLPASCFDMWKRLCRERDFNVPQQLVAGGITRFHSVKNALEKVPDDAVVMIHDGVRPFVTRALLERLLAAAGPGKAVIPVVPMVDTLRYSDGRLPDPDRSEIVAVQTPQVFICSDIREAYRQAYDTAFTDDASVAARNGIPPVQLPGERYNIKITTPDDLEFAKAVSGLYSF